MAEVEIRQVVEAELFGCFDMLMDELNRHRDSLPPAVLETMRYIGERVEAMRG